MYQTIHKGIHAKCPTEITTYQDTYTGEVTYQVPARPSSGYRKNNPHPKEGFLAKSRVKMTKDQVLKNEVRSAVQEYMNGLISQSHLGARSSISPQELMVAGRSAGHNTSHAEASSLLDTLVRPSMHMIKEAEDANITTSFQNDTRIQRPKSVPASLQDKRPYNPVPPRKSNKDYHWIVWKTSPSPTPITPEPEAVRSPTPPRIISPSKLRSSPVAPRTPSPTKFRSSSVAIRTPTPEPLQDPVDVPITPVPLKVPTPEPFRSPSVVGILRNAADAAPRSPSPYNRVPTPDLFDPDHHDQMTSPQPVPMIAEPPPEHPAFAPALKAWVSNAGDYERSVAYNLFKALNGGVSVKPNKYKSHLRARAAMSAKPRVPVAATRRYQSNGMRASIPVDTRMYPHREEQFIKDVARSLQIQEPAEYVYGRKIDIRPRAQHPPRKPPPKDYTHENSFFMNARAPYKSHFIINPEWVSENENMKKNLKLMMSTKGPNGMRYGSK